MNIHKSPAEKAEAAETFEALRQRIRDKFRVHPSAVVRFAQAFGFDGFRSLQQVCRNHLMLEKGSYRDRIRSLITDGCGGTAELVADFVSAAIGSLRDLQTGASPDKLNLAIDILKSADNIRLLGQRRSFSVVQYLHYALSQLECRALLADGTGGMLESQMARCGRDDAVIAVSFFPYASQVVDIASNLSAAGVKVMAITDSPLSPLSAASDVSFEIFEGDRPFRSLVPPICLSQILVVGLGQALQKPAAHGPDGRPPQALALPLRP